MTCRNYIPGPNGDCQRCGEMISGHAGRPAALHEALGVLYSRLHGQMSPAERHELLEAITILKGDVEMRAGHAGGDTPKVKRYNIHAVSISEEPDGEWVRYDDAGINQCDGCRRGLPLRGNGIHYEDRPFAEAMPVMACEKDMRAGHAGGEKRMTDDPRKLREQIGYLIGMLQLRGDPRSLPEILDEVERATEDK